MLGLFLVRRLFKLFQIDLQAEEVFLGQLVRVIRHGFFPPQSNVILGSTILYTRSLSSVAMTISTARKIVVAMISG